MQSGKYVESTVETMLESSQAPTKCHWGTLHVLAFHVCMNRFPVRGTEWLTEGSSSVGTSPERTIRDMHSKWGIYMTHEYIIFIYVP